MESKLVTVAQFDDPTNANLMLGLLTSAEMDAVLTNETMVGVAWHLSTAVGGICLQVRQEDADLAREILDAKQSVNIDPEIPDGFFDETDIENPVNQAREDLVRRAFMAGVISLAMTPLIIYAMILVGRAFFAKGELKTMSKVKLAFTAALGPVVVLIAATMIVSIP